MQQSLHEAQSSRFTPYICSRLQVLASDFSPQAAAAVMRRLSKWSARFIGERGFSIGVDDVIPMPRLSEEVANVTASSYEACQVSSTSRMEPASPWEAEDDGKYQAR